MAVVPSRLDDPKLTEIWRTAGKGTYIVDNIRRLKTNQLTVLHLNIVDLYID